MAKQRQFKYLTRWVSSYSDGLAGIEKGVGPTRAITYRTFTKHTGWVGIDLKDVSFRKGVYHGHRAYYLIRECYGSYIETNIYRRKEVPNG